MALPPFAVTFDYRCPFARTAHEHLVTALQGGADWDVRFVGFSLDQPHVEPGQPAAWTDPARIPGNHATLAGISVRDHQTDRFLAVHHALFTARHERRLDVRDLDAVLEVVESAGADRAAVVTDLASGRPHAVLGEEHTGFVDSHAVFGVPTFIVDDSAVFVRLMERPAGDSAVATRTVERIIDTITDWPALNEFKHSTVSR